MVELEMEGFLIDILSNYVMLLHYCQTMYQEDCQMEVSTSCHPTRFTSSNAQFGSQEQVNYLIYRRIVSLPNYSLMDVMLGTQPPLRELC